MQHGSDGSDQAFCWKSLPRKLRATSSYIKLFQATKLVCDFVTVCAGFIAWSTPGGICRLIGLQSFFVMQGFPKLRVLPQEPLVFLALRSDKNRRESHSSRSHGESPRSYGPFDSTSTSLKFTQHDDMAQHGSTWLNMTQTSAIFRPLSTFSPPRIWERCSWKRAHLGRWQIWNTWSIIPWIPKRRLCPNVCCNSNCITCLVVAAIERRIEL